MTKRRLPEKMRKYVFRPGHVRVGGRKRRSEQIQAALNDKHGRKLMAAQGDQFFVLMVQKEVKGKAFASVTQLKRFQAELEEQMRKDIEDEGGLYAFFRMCARKDPVAMLEILMRQLWPQR